MKNILVTGSRGFIGRNLVCALRRRDDVHVHEFHSSSDPDTLPRLLDEAHVVYHLAGVNRPRDDAQFDQVNRGLTERIIALVDGRDSPPAVVFSSSTQAERDNPYGRSKQSAEQALLSAAENGLPVCVYRLPGVFGKWSRPHYNTVVATFCHNIARGEPITISDPGHELTLVYVDDVVRSLSSHIDAGVCARWGTVTPEYRVSLGELADRVRAIHAIRETKVIPDLSDGLTRRLYTTYLSFLPDDGFAYPAEMRADDRGWLFELVKSDASGQIFVSTTRPGVTRGNHYHDSKVEKFCVVQGAGLIRLRHLHSDQVLEYPVDAERVRIVDIPPGYTHSIENVGETDMVTLFWANEVFDPASPDTYWVEVQK